ncbi:hypothetical protein [Fructilactobacillus fructivorans]|uniref:Lipoprotein n=1 Tax=Fructilactobacillus fructivorans TaxID=1614 RepID=A0A0C1PNQ9_9LACO|nr:hypothetical protein [Fructilactobacillus fructivorans]KID42377.1 hypothetical protein LfDm3_0306 [Fructilactobacillus fructivorans]MCT0151006.1 hypothetical protein [Fructilactobacillus fructivorans]MCT2867436.1 hypothetical protein [Fructilactobacillus fructivorans]MCT2869045.1 hypothetical protein [Fructilactobacillus fructivorans]MCT2873235.1 hypothetical protein [Fructilactobacillus fructivorans]
MNNQKRDFHLIAVTVAACTIVVLAILLGCLSVSTHHAKAQNQQLMNKIKTVKQETNTLNANKTAQKIQKQHQTGVNITAIQKSNDQVYEKAMKMGYTAKSSKQRQAASQQMKKDHFDPALIKMILSKKGQNKQYANQKIEDISVNNARYDNQSQSYNAMITITFASKKKQKPNVLNYVVNYSVKKNKTTLVGQSFTNSFVALGGQEING